MSCFTFKNYWNQCCSDI